MTTAAFLLWPLVGLAFFRMLPFHAAVAATVIGGYLLLPMRGGFDLPLIPHIGKEFVSAVTAVVLAMIFAPKTGVISRPGWIPLSPGILILTAVLLLGGFGTVLTNGDPIWTGADTLPGLRPYDALSNGANILVGLLPFLVARKYFATAESHRTLLLVLAVAGLGYSLLALYEIRMSPQLNRIVYGFFPHDWKQHVRDGGFRPVVFLNHALWLGIFLACACLSAFALWRIDRSDRRPLYLAGGLWLLMTIVLAKNFGAMAITVLAIPAILVMPFRLQILGAAAVATAITVYPFLRINDLAPTTWVVETVREVSPQRVGSFEFRLEHEDMFLARAKQRPVFGWGGWKRGRIFDERGRDIATTDGQWIISFSQGGWVRYIAEYGLLSYAIFALALRWRRYPLAPATAALSLVLAANLLDLIPNATLTAVTMIMAGALAGRLELARDDESEALPQDAGEGAPERARRPGLGRPRGESAARPVATFSRFAPKPGRNL
jgi:hypothetical protein